MQTLIRGKLKEERFTVMWQVPGGEEIRVKFKISTQPVNTSLCSQVFVSAPIDLVKVRLQSQTNTSMYRGPVHCVAVILREDGLKGLFRGGLALALRDIPCYGLYFLPYEVTCKALTESGKEPGQWKRDVSTLVILM